jgi:hypothetical protein
MDKKDGVIADKEATNLALKLEQQELSAFNSSLETDLAEKEAHLQDSEDLIEELEHERESLRKLLEERAEGGQGAGERRHTAVQTELGADFFRDLQHNPSSKVSMSGSEQSRVDQSRVPNRTNVRNVGGGGRIAKPGRLAQKSAASAITSSGRMNNDSSTAFGTLPAHNASVGEQQLDSNLIHNQSIEMEGYEQPTARNARMRVDPIQEEDHNVDDEPTNAQGRYTGSEFSKVDGSSSSKQFAKSPTSRSPKGGAGGESSMSRNMMRKTASLRKTHDQLNLASKSMNTGSGSQLNERSRAEGATSYASPAKRTEEKGSKSPKRLKTKVLHKKDAAKDGAAKQRLGRPSEARRGELDRSNASSKPRLGKSSDQRQERSQAHDHVDQPGSSSRRDGYENPDHPSPHHGMIVNINTADRQIEDQIPQKESLSQSQSLRGRKQNESQSQPTTLAANASQPHAAQQSISASNPLMQAGAGGNDYGSITGGPAGLPGPGGLPVNLNMPSIMNHTANVPRAMRTIDSGSTIGVRTTARAPANREMNAALKDSISQNNRKVVGASSIRSLIRSAATRDPVKAVHPKK